MSTSQQSNGYITYHVPQQKARYPELSQASPELKTYIREHALNYVGKEPSFTDKAYTVWYEKLIKIENKVYAKYMEKYANDQQHEQRESSPVSSSSGSETAANSPRSSSDDDDGNVLQFEYDILSQKYNQLLMQQKSISDIQAKFMELETYNKILLEQQSKTVSMDLLQRQMMEVQQQNNAQNQVIQQLLEQNKQIKLENDNLNTMNVTMEAQHEQYENAKLLMQLEFMKYQQKYESLENQYEALVLKDELREIKLDKLEKERSDLKNVEMAEKRKKTAVYAEWNAEQIVNWIIDIDSDRYSKYLDILLENMEKEGIDGQCLDDLDKNDLYRLGIVQFKDKKNIYQHLIELVESKNTENGEGGH